MLYDAYNREERALCAHLFRLLHEGLATHPETSPLARLLERARARGLAWPSASSSFEVTRDAVILTEVALIRDAYHHRKPHHVTFMDELVELVRAQENAPACRSYSALPSSLSDHRLTHPKQIARKGRDLGLLTLDELRVYGAVQGMFNAKPDLAIALPGGFIVFEAKFTERFDAAQLARTRRIAEVWAKHLATDLGYTESPQFTVARLGQAGCGAELTWTDVLEVARETHGERDRTRIALDQAVRMLDRRKST